EFERDVSDGWCVLVPAGMWHDVINTGDEPMRLHAIYAPVHHAAGKVHEDAAAAPEDEESGNDEPPEWSVQPSASAPDPDGRGAFCQRWHIIGSMRGSVLPQLRPWWPDPTPTALR